MDTPNDNPKTHLCRKCGRELPLTDEFFYREKRYPIGFATPCKECRKTASKQWHWDNQEKANARSKNRYHNEPEKRAEYQRTHVEEIARAKRNWRQNNPDKVREEKKRSHLKHREYNNARTKRWYEANREHANRLTTIANRERYANDPKYRAMHKARAHRRRMAEGELTKELILELYNEQEGRCIYCGITLHDEYTLEHILPISRGGTNERDNLACACPFCNYSKNDKTLEEWQAVRGW